MDECINGRINEQMDIWMNECNDGWINENING